MDPIVVLTTTGGSRYDVRWHFPFNRLLEDCWFLRPRLLIFPIMVRCVSAMLSGLLCHLMFSTRKIPMEPWAILLGPVVQAILYTRIAWTWGTQDMCAHP